MKKRNQLFILTSLSMLFSCTEVKKDAPKEEAKPKAELVTLAQVPTLEKLAPDSTQTKKNSDILSGITYSFSSDSLCQTINIKEISKSKKFKMPQKLAFKLILHDKLHKYEDKIFEGIAELKSPEESFSDNSEKDGGDYFAADYNLETTDYRVKIRLDIERYEACVVLITAPRLDTVLGGYSVYMKEFPSDGVMKKGQCK